MQTSLNFTFSLSSVTCGTDVLMVFAVDAIRIGQKSMSLIPLLSWNEMNTIHEWEDPLSVFKNSCKRDKFVLSSEAVMWNDHRKGIFKLTFQRFGSHWRRDNARNFNFKILLRWPIHSLKVTLLSKPTHAWYQVYACMIPRSYKKENCLVSNGICG